jgi:DNA-binding response OmpR family regulator
MTTTPRILIVEDDAHIRRLLRATVERAGYRAGEAATAREGLSLLDIDKPDLVLLDLGLPDRDGLEVLKELRAAHIHVPILVLTARDAVEARVAALDLGADDYLVKPFAFAELVARIGALARRAGGPRWTPSTEVPITMRDDLVVEATANGQAMTAALSPREYALLGCLLRRRGEVVTRAEILREAFGYEFDPGTNVIDVHLTHLRKKLTGFPLAIETVRGAGIRLTVAV